MATCSWILSENEFRELAESFCKKQKQLGNDWEINICNLKDELSEMFIVCEKTIELSTVHVKGCTSLSTSTAAKSDSPVMAGEPSVSSLGDSMVLREESDEDPYCVPSSSVRNVATCVYHVLYSHTYQVPVLYFSCCHSNGQPLSIEEVWSNVPSVHQGRVSHNSWSMISQEEHPILGRPFYYIHPCHTTDAMKCLWTRTSPVDYLTSWLSMFGPLVGLDLPLPL